MPTVSLFLWSHVWMSCQQTSCLGPGIRKWGACLIRQRQTFSARKKEGTYLRWSEECLSAFIQQENKDTHMKRGSAENKDKEMNNWDLLEMNKKSLTSFTFGVLWGLKCKIPFSKQRALSNTPCCNFKRAASLFPRLKVCLITADFLSEAEKFKHCCCDTLIPVQHWC